MADTGEHLDLSSGPDPPPSVREVGGGGKFLGVHFQCCDVYGRVYPNREQTAYVGHCPRCGGRVQFLVGPGGTDARFFRAY